MDGIKKILLVLLTCAFFIVTALSVDILLYAKKDIPVTAPQRFNIAPGQSFDSVLQGLFSKHLIDHPKKARIIARILGYDRKIRAAEYLIKPGINPVELFEMLSSGKGILHRVTIPEGYTIVQIAQILEKAGLVSAKDFIRTAKKRKLLDAYGIAADSFEGYLFPDTYLFSRNAGPVKIVKSMADRFFEVFDQKMLTRAKELNMSVHQVVILASMIEKETATPEERPLISSVFHNRLRKKMRLESDPTVIYGIVDFNGNLTRKDLKTPGPYNTYTKRGLPFGPIANPGKESLTAALYPARTDFLYFVSKKDGSHKFSKTYAEHLKAVRKYQLKAGSN